MAARDAARQQLAAKNGKPRDLNKVAGQTSAQAIYDGKKGTATASDGSTVHRAADGTVYRYVPKYDQTMIMNEDGSSSQPMKGNQIPGMASQKQSGGIDSMIDTVLEKSGMTAPVPQSRPVNSGMTGTENNPGKAADDMVAEPNDTGDMEPDANDPNESAEQGMSVGQMLLAALGVGGGIYGAKTLYDGWKERNGVVDPTAATATPASAMDQSIAASMGDEPAPAIGKEDRLALPAPQGKLPPNGAQNTGPVTPSTPQDMHGNNLPMDSRGWPPGTEKWSQPSPVEESIARTLSDEEFDQRFQNNVEQSGARPSGQTRYSSANKPTIDANIAKQAAQMADAGDRRGAVQLLRENGVELSDEMLRMLAESSNTAKTLRQRAGQIAGQAARKGM